MEKTTFQREKQRISASDILEQIASGREIRLNQCSVSGDLDINRLFVKDEGFDTSDLAQHTTDEKTTLALTQPIFFSSCVFEGNVVFAPAWDKPDQLEVIFKRDVVFNSSSFSGQTRFSGASFHGLAGFDGCTFQRIATFRSATFHSRAMCRTAVFDGYALFDSSVFCSEARFTNTAFGKGGNFTRVKFKGSTDFSGAFSKSKTVPLYESVRFAKRPRT